MMTNIAAIRRLIADEALALGITNYIDNWTIVPDAARREGLPRQINSIDCGRYVILTALCLTHTPLPRYWYNNSLRYSAKVYEMQKCSASSLASCIRIVMNKG